ncbi:MAG: hypothetical protein HQM14_09610 [SAR324 cluster bacterium]|nr:hypothetical protein [SAR324 cluster bacterium]
MRYFWLLFACAFLGFGVLFADQNQEMVTIKFSLKWLNFYLTTGKHPFFISFFATLGIGVFLTTSYFFFYHSYLRIRIKSQESEIFRLKKLVLMEREKQKKLDQGKTESNQKRLEQENQQTVEVEEEIRKEVESSEVVTVSSEETNHSVKSESPQ